MTAVVRGYDARVDAELGKRLRERADDVGQPAGLGERRALPADAEQYVRQSITPGSSRGAVHEILFMAYFLSIKIISSAV